MRLRTILAFTATMAVLSSAFAASPVGKWKGKVQITPPPMPKTATAEQKKQMEAGLAQIRKMVMNMELKANKTYTVTVTGGPMKQDPDTGTWSVAGNKITFTSSKNKAQKQTMDLSKDGKTISLSQSQGASSMKITFTKS